MATPAVEGALHLDTVDGLQELVVAFSRRRDWNNAPHNLATSVAIEAAEILEIYQWKGTDTPLTPGEREALALECADVFWYLLRLCRAEGIDLAVALRAKIAINETRFPAVSEAR